MKTGYFVALWLLLGIGSSVELCAMNTSFSHLSQSMVAQTSTGYLWRAAGLQPRSTHSSSRQGTEAQLADNNDVPDIDSPENSPNTAAVQETSVSSTASASSAAHAAESNTWDSFCRFVEEQLQIIREKIDGVNESMQTQSLDGSCIIVNGLNPEEIERHITPLRDNLIREIHEFANEDNRLEDFSRDMNHMIDLIQELRGGVYCIASLIADDDNTLFEQITRQYGYLTDVGISPDGAYEVLGFNRNNRNVISAEQIREVYERLSDQYDGVKTPEGRKIRQAGFTLSNPYGKQIYDAFLSGREHLAMKRISREKAELLGIRGDSEILSIKLATLNNSIEAIKKVVDKKKIKTH